ncbi:MAG TPA: hypothetical protein VGL18_13210 [Actinomycetota bacterium]
MRAHSLLRMIMEDIATMPFESYDEAIRLAILAEIDGLPVASRTELGQLLDWMLEHVGQVVGDQRRWAVRRTSGIRTCPTCCSLPPLSMTI